MAIEIDALSIKNGGIFPSFFVCLPEGQERIWWLIPLSKWDITPVINGISRVNPLITGVITHLLSGMSHQVSGDVFYHVYLCHPQFPSNDGTSRPDRRRDCRLGAWHGRAGNWHWIRWKILGAVDRPAGCVMFLGIPSGKRCTWTIVYPYTQWLMGSLSTTKWL